jgi:hypothetical protein
MRETESYSKTLLSRFVALRVRTARKRKDNSWQSSELDSLKEESSTGRASIHADLDGHGSQRIEHRLRSLAELGWAK